MKGVPASEPIVVVAGKLGLRCDPYNWTVVERHESEKLGVVWSPLGYFGTLEGACVHLLRADVDGMPVETLREIVEAIGVAKSEVVEALGKLRDLRPEDLAPSCGPKKAKKEVEE